MGYWSDEREDLKNTIRLINQTGLNRAKENAELREEIEGLKMKIKNMKDEKESPTPIHRDQMPLPFAKWGHGRAMPRAEPDSRWNWWGMVSDDSELYNKVNNENPERES